MWHIQDDLYLDESELEIGMIRAQGAGGQHVNKVSSAVHLRFDLQASRLPADVQAAILAFPDRRISKEGVIIIKAQTFRSLEKNRAEAIERLLALLRQCLVKETPRRATKPTRASQRRRVQGKLQRGDIKRLRGRVGDE